LTAAPPTARLSDDWAERVALRSLLRYPAATAEAASAAGFRPHMLYQFAHPPVWKAARFVAGPGRRPVDLGDLFRELRRRRELDELGDSPAAFLADLWLCDPWFSDLPFWWQDDDDRLPFDVGCGQAALHKVVHLAARRTLAHKALAVYAEALNPTGGAEHLLALADALPEVEA